MTRLLLSCCLLVLLLSACKKDAPESDTSPESTPPTDSLQEASEMNEAPEEPAAEAPAWAQLHVHGAMRRVNLDKDLSPTVRLAEAQPTMNHGVGALGGLLGEVTILDDATYVARSGGEVGFDHYEGTDALEELDATLLFGATVDDWQELSLEAGTDRDGLAKALEAWREANAPGQPVPFRVIDPVANLDWHVVDATRFPEGGAANCEERKALSHTFNHSGVEATLVGIYTTEHTGIIVDHTTPIHAHVILAAGPSGHLDAFTLSEQARLLVPATP